MTNEELQDELARLAKRMRMTSKEIWDMVRMTVQAEFDPLPIEDCGEPFVWPRFRVNLIALDDFTCINAEVPKPNAQIDLLRALSEFISDAQAIACIDMAELSIEKLFLVVRNQRDWTRFWSVRHPNPAQRAKYSRAFANALARHQPQPKENVDV